MTLEGSDAGPLGDPATVAVITGGSGGIGMWTAIGLARRGAEVALVVRSAERGAAAREQIVRASPGARVQLLLADLGEQAQVRRVAGEIRERYSQLDVLVNNAAIYTPRRSTTSDGIETQLAVNHLAPFLLTALLRDRLLAAAGRIVTISSEAHRWGRLAWNDLGGEHRYGGLRAYCNSKLCNLLFTHELARRLAGTAVTANAAHPGVVGTELLLGGFAPLRLFKRFLRTPEQGASTPVYLASSPEVARVSGRYFRDEREIEPSAAARDAESAQRLWEISEHLTGLR